MIKNYLSLLKDEFKGYNAKSLMADMMAGLTVGVAKELFFFNSNLIPASTGIKFLVDIAFDTFDKATLRLKYGKLTKEGFSICLL